MGITQLQYLRISFHFTQQDILPNKKKIPTIYN